MVSGVTMVTLAVDGGVPEFTAAAIFFGIGAALVLDEFALILHLQDVYWSEDGRTSVDAVFAAVAVAGLLILGLNPLSFFDVNIWRDDHSLGARAMVIAIAVATLALAVIVLLKGKVWTGLVGMFITPLLFIGAIRLSRPHAPWARWRYSDRPKKMHRALERERSLRRPVVQAKLWLQHVIAGEPHFPDDHEVDQQLDREIHAAPAPPERDGGWACEVLLRHRVHRQRPHHRVDLDRCGRRGRPRILRHLNRIRPGAAGSWVRKHVLPKLPSPSSQLWRSRRQIRSELGGLLRRRR